MGDRTSDLTAVPAAAPAAGPMGDRTSDLTAVPAAAPAAGPTGDRTSDPTAGQYRNLRHSLRDDPTRDLSPRHSLRSNPIRNRKACLND